ncbi:MAG: dephospho-CoA kinase [Planctomycetota bacterium]|nr:MAG: dephospho-CoA kinase [Planctomycetota bacterium]
MCRPADCLLVPHCSPFVRFTILPVVPLFRWSFVSSPVDIPGPKAFIPLVGLVGGIGSGKSTIARGLAQRIPVAILDADRSGHETLRQPEVKVALRQAFGDSIFDPSQEVQRSQLAVLVFGSDERARQNRQTLEQIVHPVIRADIRRQLQEARDRGQVQAVLLDAPILLESGWKELCDAVVFIDTPLARRQQWTAAGRGWTPEELTRREASQWSIARKRSESDFIVDNSGDVDRAVAQLEKYVRDLVSTGSSAPSDLSPAHSNHPEGT